MGMETPITNHHARTLNPELSQDAAIVLGLAATALTFAPSPHAEAERWIRILRLHGQAGCALQGLGIGEAPLELVAEEPGSKPPDVARRGAEESATRVARRAYRLACARGSALLSTVDLLFAVVELYGPTFDRTLYERGSSREELLERLDGSIAA
jgi:hypothetical protein